MLNIIELLDIPQINARRFKLIETYNTSDGPRSRLCDGLWYTKEEAAVEKLKREKAK